MHRMYGHCVSVCRAQLACNVSCRAGGFSGMFVMQYHLRSRRADRRASHRPESHAEKLIRLATSEDIAACRSCHSTAGERNFICTGGKYPYSASPSLDLPPPIPLPTPISLREVSSFHKTDDARWWAEEAAIAPAKSGIRKILVTALCVYLPGGHAAQLLLLQHWAWFLATRPSACHSSSS